MIRVNVFTHELPSKKPKALVAKEPSDIDRDNETGAAEQGTELHQVCQDDYKEIHCKSTVPLHSQRRRRTTGSEKRIIYVYNVRVRWDKRQSSRKVTQYHRCQQIGHGSRGCYNVSRCLHCTKEHLTTKCMNRNGVPQCINCKGEHRANDLACPEYIKRVKLIEKTCEEKSTYAAQPKPKPAPTLSEFPRTRWNKDKSAPESRTTPESSTSGRKDTRQEAPQSNTNEFPELPRVMQRIHQLCNVRKMLRNLTSLANSLESYSNESEHTAAFLRWLQNGQR